MQKRQSKLIALFGIVVSILSCATVQTVDPKMLVGNWEGQLTVGIVQLQI